MNCGWARPATSQYTPDLFVQSDKLAKQARFVLDKTAWPTVSEMVLTDQLSNKKETRIRYLSCKERTCPKNGQPPCSWRARRHLE